MSFLQPWLLAALPLIALPILIHLINQRRYQTTQWAAMMFLLAANRMSRGYAKIRQWLILLARSLAIGGLIFAISRPLVSGWLGLAAGGRTDTTIILLDRSPSMREQDSGAALTKLDTGVRQLASSLEKLRSSRWVLIDSAAQSPIELQSPGDLLESPAVTPVSATADLSSMLQVAYEYVQANQSGRTDIWVCSDLRESDWKSDNARWQTLRDSFAEMPQQVRFHLLAYADTQAGNRTIRVNNVKRLENSEGAFVQVSLRVNRSGSSTDKLSVPIEFEIDGARSTLNIDMTGPQFELKDHRIPIQADRTKGWGRVSIPADSNAADNDFYFTYDIQPPRRAIIVSENDAAAKAIQLAASIPPAAEIECSAEILSEPQLAAVDWSQVGLLVWHSALPEGDQAIVVDDFLKRGGQVLFLPPEIPNSRSYLGVSWGDWKDVSELAAADTDGAGSQGSKPDVETWRGDQDLLANTMSGSSLPVGQLQVQRCCTLEGETVPLASLTGGTTLLARVPTDRGGAYFLTTTPAATDSNLATNGIVLYVTIQRALTIGSASLGQTKQLAAGKAAVDVMENVAADGQATWQVLAGEPQALSTELPFHRGVYENSEALVGVNREVAEENTTTLSDAQVNELFSGLDFARVDDKAGSLAGLVQEVWRWFLAAMLVALVAEAALCLPKAPLKKLSGAAA